MLLSSSCLVVLDCLLLEYYVGIKEPVIFHLLSYTWCLCYNYLTLLTVERSKENSIDRDSYYFHWLFHYIFVWFSCCAFSQSPLVIIYGLRSSSSCTWYRDFVCKKTTAYGNNLLQKDDLWAMYVYIVIVIVIYMYEIRDRNFAFSRESHPFFLNITTIRASQVDQWPWLWSVSIKKAWID